MAGKVSRWTPEALEDAREKIEKIGILGAAQALNITPSGLRRAFENNGLPVPRSASAAPSAPMFVAAQEARPDLLAWERFTPAKPPPVPKAATAKGRATRIAVIPDVHVPAHDRVAWACALAILKDWQPDHVVIIGDFLDCAALSRHPRSKPDPAKFAAELYAGNVALDELQGAAPGARWYYCEGNHERRAVKFANVAGEFFGLLTIPEQLCLTPRADGYDRLQGRLRGMEWIPYEKQPLLLDGVAFYHGHNCTSTHHAAWHAAKYVPAKCPGRVLLYGHMHVFQSFRDAGGGEAQCVGFLGDAGSPEMSYPEGRPTAWQHGIVLAEVEAGRVTRTPVPIVGGRALFGGRSVTARS